jgi:activator of HSP90 ATPase
MADEDNFDIDIYGDESAQDEQPAAAQVKQEDLVGNGDDKMATEQQDAFSSAADNNQHNEAEANGNAADALPKSEPGADGPKSAATPTPSMAGTKRKTYDGRNVDPNASSSTVISELHWWHTEDDVRGWCARGEVEDDIKDITFNEHKVNGKSKG